MISKVLFNHEPISLNTDLSDFENDSKDMQLVKL